ncbi:TolC family protein [Brumimicrobium mesophilum]|uniref:TolC family protein n=1 Tax=Brumimicrobium mesophilum TaxID=392717 RepID=UPI000D142209|nr:TolC family protein [Brumimicrobium mesophilum]
MLKKTKYISIFLFASLSLTSCKSLQLVKREENKTVPEGFTSTEQNSKDTLNSASLKWKEFFTDAQLINLIDTALRNNQELNIILQEIEISKYEIGAKKGEYLPTVSGYVGAGVDKVSRYTRDGAVEATTDIIPGKEFPEPLQDYVVGVRAEWEVDIWKKLRNGKKAAVSRYLSSVSGKNFIVTHLVSEIASEYYELLALDKQLIRVNQNIDLQTNALRIVKQQKESAKVTELAVRRFEAQLYSTQSLRFEIEQSIVETENKINFLVGRFPQPVLRNASTFNDSITRVISDGLPSQLLDNRMDIKQAELELASNKLDVKIAKAQFYPSLGLSAGIGLQAFDPTFIVKNPESILFSLAGDLVAPLINRAGIKAQYYSANARQLQSIYEYEKTILTAYIEVRNQLSKIENLNKSYEFKAKEVDALNESIKISNTLFKSARADYLEILLTQEETIDAQFELIEIKKAQLNAMVNTYVALGGGWN